MFTDYFCNLLVNSESLFFSKLLLCVTIFSKSLLCGTLCVIVVTSITIVSIADEDPRVVHGSVVLTESPLLWKYSQNHRNGCIKEKIIIQMTTKEPSSSGARWRAQVMMACKSVAPRVFAWGMHSACNMTCVCVFERVRTCMRVCACDSARVCVCACSTTLARATSFSTVSESQAGPEFPGLAWG
jgi:hypothetical protein